MIKANFNTYASYVTDSLYQWDLNQVLSVTGLNLTVAPEVHFSNANMDKALVRQATLLDHVVSVPIPNSLLQESLLINAHIGIYENDTFKVVELVQIPVIPKKRPVDYKIETSDEEIYSFEALKNAIANMVKSSDFNSNNSAIMARIDNIIAHNNDTEGNSELTDLRTDSRGVTHNSAGTAIRTENNAVNDDLKLLEKNGYSTFYKYAKFVRGGLNAGVINPYSVYRVSSENILHFDRDIFVKIADGFRVGFHILKEDGTFISDSYWRENAYTIPAGTYFKLVIARVVDDTTETANILEYSNAVTFNNYISDKILNIDNTLKVCDRVIKSTLATVFEPVGGYFTTNGAYPNNRIHAVDMVCKGLASITVRPLGYDDYYYGVDLYTNDGLRQPIFKSGWLSAKLNPNFLIDTECIVDLAICKLTAESYEDLTEFNGLFEVVNYDIIDNIESDLNIIKKRKAWLTSAHRGFVDNYLKENSLGAYYNAFLNGADMIETDAWLTSDGVLIVNHDPTVTGVNANGETVTYTIADTLASDICSLVLTTDSKWGTQKVPTLEQVLKLAYNTGLIVNIDLKNGYTTAEAVVKMVLKCGMKGRVIYAPNGSGLQTINKILEYDPEAKFIDSMFNFTAENLSGLQDYRSKCFAYTSSIDDDTVNSIRESGCMLALISLNASNFEKAISYCPDMCEYLHTSNFKQIESSYFENLKVY